MITDLVPDPALFSSLDNILNTGNFFTIVELLIKIVYDNERVQSNLNSVVESKLFIFGSSSGSSSSPMLPLKKLKKNWVQQQTNCTGTSGR